MVNFLELQQFFHEYFGFKANKNPGLLEPELMQMRLNFLLEELKETAEACGYELKRNDGFVSFEKDKGGIVDPEKILDGLVDLLVVLLGTVHLMGFYKKSEFCTIMSSNGPVLIKNDYEQQYTIFEEAFIRVFNANMQKEVGTTKRGCSIDLVKPEGWKAPDLSDLVEDFSI